MSSFSKGHSSGFGKGANAVLVPEKSDLFEASLEIGERARKRLRLRDQDSLTDQCVVSMLRPLDGHFTPGITASNGVSERDRWGNNYRAHNNSLSPNTNGVWSATSNGALDLSSSDHMTIAFRCEDFAWDSRSIFFMGSTYDDVDLTIELWTSLAVTIPIIVVDMWDSSGTLYASDEIRGADLTTFDDADIIVEVDVTETGSPGTNWTTWWVNGALYTPETNAVSDAISSCPNKKAWINNATGNHLDYIRVWDRKLTDQERARILRNPYAGTVIDEKQEVIYNSGYDNPPADRNCYFIPSWSEFAKLSREQTEMYAEYYDADEPETNVAVMSREGLPVINHENTDTRDLIAYFWIDDSGTCTDLQGLGYGPMAFDASVDLGNRNGRAVAREEGDAGSSSLFFWPTPDISKGDSFTVFGEIRFTVGASNSADDDVEIFGVENIAGAASGEFTLYSSWDGASTREYYAIIYDGVTTSEDTVAINAPAGTELDLVVCLTRGASGALVYINGKELMDLGTSATADLWDYRHGLFDFPRYVNGDPETYSDSLECGRVLYYDREMSASEIARISGDLAALVTFEAQFPLVLDVNTGDPTTPIVSDATAFNNTTGTDVDVSALVTFTDE